MGNCDFKKQEPTTNVGISKINFQMHYVIVRGGYGKLNKLILIIFIVIFLYCFYPPVFLFLQNYFEIFTNYLYYPPKGLESEV